MARYKDAIRWLIDNDDTGWIDSGQNLSVAAALVADLFGKDDHVVIRDCRKEISKQLREEPDE